MWNKIKDIFYDIGDFIVVAIIVGAIIFAISVIMKSTVGIDFQKQLSPVSKVEQPAKETTKNQESSDGKQVSATANDNIKEKNNNQEKAEGKETTPSKTDKETKPANGPKEETPKEETPKENEQQSLTIEYKEGAPLSEFIEALKSKGVVEDQENFLNYLVEKELDTLVQPGTYTFEKAMTNEAVVKVLFP